VSRPEAPATAGPATSDARTSARPLALGDSELMAQHQDLRVLPPRLPLRQAQRGHRTEHDQEEQFQAHRQKSSCASTRTSTTPTGLHRTLKQAAPLRPLPDIVTDSDHLRVQRRDGAESVIHEYRLVA